MNHQTRYQEAITFVSPQLRQGLEKLSASLQEQVHEIRLRGGRPVVLVLGDQSVFISINGEILKEQNDHTLFCSYECLEQTFRAVCGYSVHTHQKEMIRGYITLKGGHRAGLCGSAVERMGEITAIKEISSINIRVARQVFGAADSLVDYAKKGGLLLAGPPGSGKTTLLRDLARQLSGGDGLPGEKVALLDERGELAAMWDGIPQNDVGPNTDILNGFSKVAAMEMAVRCLSPQVIICDEIGSAKEAQGMLGCVNAGVRMIASVHAGNMEELAGKTWVMALLKAGVFSTVALLSGTPGKDRAERIVRVNDWLDKRNRHLSAGGGNQYDGDTAGWLV